MSNRLSSRRILRFEPFALDPSERVLLRDGDPVPVPPKDIEVLLVLLENRGHIVEKKDLLEKIWPGTFIEEGNLARHISSIRSILAEGVNSKIYIETIPKRGYRFVATVDEIDKPGSSEDSQPAQRTIDPCADAPRAADSVPLAKHRANVLPTVIIIAVLLLAGFFFLRRTFIPSSHRVTLLVLPVLNLTGNSDREYFTDGLTEELIAVLGSLNPKQLGVIARTSSMAYKNSERTLEQIGHQPAADYVLETSLRGNDEEIQVTVQLIRVVDQTHLWTESYDRSLRDVVNVQNEIARNVARQIEIRVSSLMQQRLQVPRPVNPEAYREYLEGRSLASLRTRDALEKSVELFEQATRLDPANARAYAALADSYNLLVFYGYHPGAVDIFRAIEAAKKSIELDGSLAEGHASIGYANSFWIWDWSTANREFQQAIKLDDNYAPAHHWYALYLSSMGRHFEAIQEIQVAQRLDPRSPIVSTAVGYVRYFARDFDGAIRECRAVLKDNPNFPIAHAALGLAQEGKGNFLDAAREFQTAIDLSGSRSAIYLGYLGSAEAKSGALTEATNLLDELDERAKLGTPTLTPKAIIYAALGKNAKAIECLQAGREQHEGGQNFMLVDPHYDRLRTDPRFLSLLLDMGLKP